MVRRWSCINTLNTEYSYFNNFEKRHKIINFKTSVNLKRFSFKLTKFRRKTMARFKHTSNWLIYTNLIKFWVKDYIFTKNFSKSQYLIQILIKNYLLFNFNFIKMKNDSFSYNFNFLISTQTKKTYLYFHKNFSNIFKNNNITFAWYNDQLITTNSIIPTYNLWENNFYSPLITKESAFSFNYNIETLLDLNFYNTLNYLITIRRVLIILFFNLNFKNVK